MSADSLTTEDLQFLSRPLHGFVSVAAGPTPPQPRPVWFEAAGDGTVQLFTAPDSAKVRRLQQDPRASIVVAAPVGERERWVSVTGRTTVVSDGADELLRRLASRYWDLTDPDRSRDLAEMLTHEWVRVMIHADKVSRYTA
ncbi:pyridoxamine 5'-phosphate oxidase family protein [Mycolicibacterium wolinskyi]|uniref:Pyridoxamine 5'-phosphate oxidase n=1 Tax=Mycolicibacterium wolinskyi TaxID=59750 RepID=A0A1X2F204_9MYCO|nr:MULTISPECIES: pyridoxamine 5'-phosphate oxidase family protein [Mycolicibacterium]MCV7287828.1 pyridoxamine 5'-phosphate oxidase family protein [Mycolicibacterium wolinskyi]MCV7294726.1 pyridoxamine 5'-phosphate oxidase family protein [Mycolicibacterium goodii]ORX12415.1 pyridoxamine 5'-phosphate oxidase [Mycolicibacterium wolinskyi]